MDGVIKGPGQILLLSLGDSIFYLEVPSGNRWSHPIVTIEWSFVGCGGRRRTTPTDGDVGIVVLVGNVAFETARTVLDLNLAPASTNAVLVTTNVAVCHLCHVWMFCRIVHQIVLPPRRGETFVRLYEPNMFVRRGR